MEVIELPHPAACSIAVSGGAPVASADYLYGPDGFLQSLWGGHSIPSSPLDMVLGGLPPYRHIYKGNATRDTVTRGRYDLLVTPWSPILAEWDGDVLASVSHDTIAACTATLSPLYSSRSVIRDAHGGFYFWGSGRQSQPSPIGAPITLPARPVNVDEIIAAMQKKYGEPSSPGLDYLLSDDMVVKSMSPGDRDPPSSV